MKILNQRLAILALAAASLVAAGAEELKHVFFFIGDGMGTGPVLTAQTFNRMVKGAEEPLLMMSFPVASNVYTYSWSSPVTDSAAGGTALATGTKTRNNMVGMGPDSVAVRSIASRLLDLGWNVGVITSNSPDDATPASFTAHQPARNMYYEIGRDMTTSGFDFFGGAPLRGLTDKKGKPTDLMAMFEAMGYETVTSAAGLDSITAPRVLAQNPTEGLSNSLGYAIDGPTDGFDLEQLTRACLSTLERKGESFFMMVEDGLIDHSLHANDAPTAVRQILDFQRAIQVAYDFYLRNPDNTLIIVTADHDTGGMTLGNSNPAVKYNAHLEMLEPIATSKASFSRRVKALFSQKGTAPTWEEMQQLLANEYGFWEIVPVDEAETERLHTLFNEALQGRNDESRTLYDASDKLTDTVYDILHSHAGIGFISTYHTGGFVPIYAIGEGASRFASLNNNTDIAGKIWDTLMESLPPTPLMHQPAPLPQ